MKSSAWSSPVNCLPRLSDSLGIIYQHYDVSYASVSAIGILLAVIILLSIALILGLRKTVTLSIDGRSTQITTYAFKVGDLLHSQDIPLSPLDQLSPPRMPG